MSEPEDDFIQEEGSEGSDNDFDLVLSAKHRTSQNKRPTTAKTKEVQRYAIDGGEERKGTAGQAPTEVVVLQSPPRALSSESAAAAHSSVSRPGSSSVLKRPNSARPSTAGHKKVVSIHVENERPNLFELETPKPLKIHEPQLSEPETTSGPAQSPEGSPKGNWKARKPWQTKTHHAAPEEQLPSGSPLVLMGGNKGAADRFHEEDAPLSLSSMASHGQLMPPDFSIKNASQFRPIRTVEDLRPNTKLLHSVHIRMLEAGLMSIAKLPSNQSPRRVARSRSPAQSPNRSPRRKASNKFQGQHPSDFDLVFEKATSSTSQNSEAGAEAGSKRHHAAKIKVRPQTANSTVTSNQHRVDFQKPSPINRSMELQKPVHRLWGLAGQGAEEPSALTVQIGGSSRKGSLNQSSSAKLSPAPRPRSAMASTKPRNSLGVSLDGFIFDSKANVHVHRPSSAVAANKQWVRWSHDRTTPIFNTHLAKAADQLESERSNFAFETLAARPCSASSRNSRPASAKSTGLSLSVPTRQNEHKPPASTRTRGSFRTPVQGSYTSVDAPKIRRSSLDLVGRYLHDDHQPEVSSRQKAGFVEQLRINTQDTQKHNRHKVTHNVFIASKEQLVAHTDPSGDFSWTVSDPKAYLNLTRRMMERKDWDSFKIIMCDLRFLWRKVHENGALSLIETYEASWLGLDAENKLDEKLKAYREFFVQHFKTFHAHPSQMLLVAVTAKQDCVKKDCLALLRLFEELILFWDEKFKNPDTLSAAPGPRYFDDHPENESPMSKKLKRLSLVHILEMVNAKVQLTHYQEYGIASCLPEDVQEKFVLVMETLMQKIRSNRAMLQEQGMHEYRHENELILGLHDKFKIHLREQPKEFSDLTHLWANSDAEEYLCILVYIPPKTWKDEKRRHAFEVELCEHVAEAARGPLELVDISEMVPQHPESRNGTMCRTILRLIEHVIVLEVKVIAGAEWPKQEHIAKQQPYATLNLRESKHKKHRKQAHSLMAVKSQETLYTAKPKHEENFSMSHLTFGQKFSFLIFDNTQELVVQCYDHSANARSPFGEVALPVQEVLQMCHMHDNETFDQVYKLNKPGSRKTAQYRTGAQEGGQIKIPTVHLQFSFITHQANNSITPARMVDNIMTQLIDEQSHLRIGSSVHGPAFLDQGGSYETVRIYVSSNYAECYSERNFLFRYVFPALLKRSLSRRIHFKVSDLSTYGVDKIKDDIVARLNTLRNSKIRSCDPGGKVSETMFVVALIGESRGRVLDSRDIRRLQKANRLSKGDYDWAIQQAKNDISVQELEIKTVLESHAATADSIFCVRDPEFLKSKEFLHDLPADILHFFKEASPDNQKKARHFRNDLKHKAKDSMVHYHPKYVGFVSEGEDVDAKRNARNVRFAGLADFGIQVFDKIWDVIRQRYPSSRGRNAVNWYMQEHQKQVKCVRAYRRRLHIQHKESQGRTITTLLNVSDFMSANPSFSLLAGHHGSGKSSILAEVVTELHAIFVDEKREKMRELEEHNTSDLLKSKVSGMVNIFRLRSAFSQERKNSTESKEEAKRSTSPSPPNSAERAPSNSVERAMKDQHHFFFDQSNEDQEKVKEILREKEIQEAKMQKLLDQGYTLDWVQFAQQGARVIFFFRRTEHTLHDFLGYVCSALLHRQDLHPPSWRRLEEILRQIVYAQDTEDLDRNEFAGPVPVLFLMDGLTEDERTELRRILFKLEGRVRTICTVDLQHLTSQEHKLRDKSRLMTGQVIYNSPLSLEERRHILTSLFDRVGAKRQTENLDPILLRAEAMNPQYLVVVAGYIQSCLGMSCTPAPMAALKPTIAELFAFDFLPVAESVFGKKVVSVFLEIITSEPEGKSKKDVDEVLFKCKCAVDEATLELLFDSFRPFSDILNSDSHNDLSLNGRCIREALLLRNAADIEDEDENRVFSGFKQAADSQDIRISKIQAPIRKRGMKISEGARELRITDTEHQEQSDKEGEGPEWRSDSSDNESAAEERLEFRRRSLSWERREVILHLGGREWKINKGLFDQYVVAKMEENNSQDFQHFLDLELKEILRILVNLQVIPTYASNTEAAQAFRAVVRHRQRLEMDVANDDHLNFPEFLHFMECLQKIVSSRGDHHPGDHHDQQYAATVIQKRLRGLQARQKTKQKRHEKTMRELEDRINGDEKQKHRVVRIQALARQKRERKTLEQLQRQRHELKEFDKAQDSATKQVCIKVRGKTRKQGILGEIQKKIKQLFDSSPEAFVYMDNDGNDCITPAEFTRGFAKIGIVGKQMNHVCVMAAADGLIDSIEFLRLFSWHDIEDADAELSKAKLDRRKILNKIADRRREMAVTSPKGRKKRVQLF